jgi:hypothetical protein
MSIKTLLLIGGLGYGYLYLKNNSLLPSSSTAEASTAINNIQQGGTLTKKSTTEEILINTLPVSNTEKYQLVYDVIYDSHRYTLYVFKNWVRKDVPKPFITQEEYKTLTDVQKQKYNLNQSIAGNYKWYQVNKINGLYNTIQNDPLSVTPTAIIRSIASKPLPLGFIPAYSYNEYKPSETTTGQSVNIMTPVNPSTANNTAKDTELGITVPLNNLQRLKQLLYSYGIKDLYKIGSEFINGTQVIKYVINPTINTVDSVYNNIKKSGLILDVKKLITSPTVKSADTYHPVPVASKI